MLNLFKKKCPVCTMALGEKSYESHGKKFCSEECRETYGKQSVKQESNKSGCGCCH